MCLLGRVHKIIGHATWRLKCGHISPIEKQAYEAYTRDLYHKFREEFEMIGRYNVRPCGAHLYELEPNREWVAKYGSRHYYVTVEIDAGNYTCECCKMNRDGLQSRRT